MSTFFWSTLLLPTVGFFVISLIREKRQAWVGDTAVMFSCLNFLHFIWIASVFLFSDQDRFLSSRLSFDLDKANTLDFLLIFDKISVTFYGTLCFLILLVSFFARNYLLGESGYKRFFLNLQVFVFGYTLVIFSSGLEMLLAGWEMVGLASFLLIAFYSYRVRPIKNALKVFILYRVGDLGLFLASWALHHVPLLDPHGFQLVGSVELVEKDSYLIAAGFFLLLSAAVKSAQVPFSFWIPKAMEGPTPSSAIFYGSLSIHLGLFLLMRTQFLWEHQIWVRVAIFLVGLSSFGLGVLCSGIQSNLKARLGYASVSQVGILFMEIALGLLDLALIHFVSHAVIRSYQILISGAAVTYLIDKQSRSIPADKYFGFGSWIAKLLQWSVFKRIRLSIYVIAQREGFLELLFEKIFWKPVVRLGWFMNQLVFKSPKLALIGFAAGVGLAIGIEVFRPGSFEFIYVIGFLALVLGTMAVHERANPVLAWVWIGMSQVLSLLSFQLEATASQYHSILFLSGVAVSWLAGFLVLFYRESLLKKVSHSTVALVFLLGALGISGFPVTPSFFGEKLVLNTVQSDHLALVVLFGMSFVLVGITSMRLYAKQFLFFEGK